MTLADLPTAFIEARAQAASTARYSKSTVPPDTCRYCGRPMVRWHSRLADGHSRHLVPESFQRELYELWLSDPAASQQRIATLCGVGPGTVKSWISNVETRIGRAA